MRSARLLPTSRHRVCDPTQGHSAAKRAARGVIESKRGVRFPERRPALTSVYRPPSAAPPSWYDEAEGGAFAAP
jgi:hypothetical protein